MDKLDYLLTLAEERNLTRSAAKLYISQPTLTTYLNRIEAELGVKLFDRSVQPVRITEAGRLYLDEMQKISRQEKALRTKLQILGRKSDHFTIGIPPVRGEYLLPQLLAALRQQFPALNIHVELGLESQLLRLLEQGQVDVAIGSMELDAPGISCELLRSDAIFVLVPRDRPWLAHLPETEGTPEHPLLVEPSRLDGECLLLPTEGGGQYRLAMRLMEQFHIVPGTTVHCNQLNTLYRSAAAGVGMLVTTPRPFLQAFPHLTSQLVFCQLGPQPEYQSTWLLYRDQSASDVLQAVLAHLRRAEAAQSTPEP